MPPKGTNLIQNRRNTRLTTATTRDIASPSQQTDSSGSSRSQGHTMDATIAIANTTTNNPSLQGRSSESYSQDHVQRRDAPSLPATSSRTAVPNGRKPRKKRRHSSSSSSSCSSSPEPGSTKITGSISRITSYRTADGSYKTTRRHKDMVYHKDPDPDAPQPDTQQHA